MSTGTLYKGDIAAHSPYEQPVARITNVTLVASRLATAQRVHAVSPTQLLQCLGRVFDDEIDHLSQWRIIDVFLTQSPCITYEDIRELGFQSPHG